MRNKYMEKEFKAGKSHIGVGGGVLIFNKKGEVLIMKRGKKAKNQAGWWCKPGGQVEYGESAVKAMKREIKEETNLNIDIWGILPHTDHIIKGEGEHWLSVNFLANVKSGTLKNMEPHKCDELKWFALNELPKKLTQTTREPVKNYLAKKYIKL